MKLKTVVIEDVYNGECVLKSLEKLSGRTDIDIGSTKFTSALIPEYLEQWLNYGEDVTQYDYHVVMTDNKKAVLAVAYII